MNKFLTIFLLLLMIKGMAQSPIRNPIPYDNATKKYAYSEVIEIESRSPAEMYLNAKAWLLKKYTREEYILDKSDEQVIKEGAFEFNFYGDPEHQKWGFKWTVTFSIDIEFKPNKFRYVITNIKLSHSSPTTIFEYTLEKWIENGVGGPKSPSKAAIRSFEAGCDTMNVQFLEVISELKQGVRTKAEDDW